MSLRLTVSTLAIIMVGSSAQADICEDILGLRADGTDLSLHLPGGGPKADCKTSLMLSGGSQVHCGFGFTYRAPAATTAFEGLVNAVTDCLGDAAHVTADLDVNHPDFYDLQTFQLKGQEIGVSLKDKSALSQTYVFVRVSNEN